MPTGRRYRHNQRNRDRLGTCVATRLFSRLATPDRSWVVLPESDHAAHVENAMPARVDANVDFPELPRPGLELKP